MKNISPKLIEDLDALLKSHGIDNIGKGDALGQVLAHIDAGCPANIRWMTGGLVFAHAYKHDAIGTIKRLVEALAKSGRPQGGKLNYNDMDCDLHGWYFVIDMECLECSSIVSKIEAKRKGEPEPTKEGCKRCKGTGVEPEFHNYAWVVHYKNHGYDSIYAVTENCLRYELHVRELPYNSPDKMVAEAVDGMISAIQKDQYDTDCKWLRYRDMRDEGFVLSMDLDKPRDGWPEGCSQGHDCEASLRAISALDTIIEHFPCVIEPLEKGEEP